MATKLKNIRHTNNDEEPYNRRMHPIKSWIAFFLAVNMALIAVIGVVGVFVYSFSSNVSTVLNALKASVPTVNIYEADEYGEIMISYATALGNYITSDNEFYSTDSYLGSLESEINNGNIIVYAKNNDTGKEYGRNTPFDDYHRNGILFTDGEFYFITPDKAGADTLTATALRNKNDIEGEVKLDDMNLHAAVYQYSFAPVGNLTKQVSTPMVSELFGENDITIYVLALDNDEIDSGYGARLSSLKRTLTIVNAAFSACIVYALLLIFLIVYASISRPDRIYANEKIAEFLDLLWLEIKLVFSAAVLFVAPSALLDFYFNDIIYMTLTAILLMWLLYFVGIDLRHNGLKRCFSHNIFASGKVYLGKHIEKAVNGYNQSLRDAPLTKAMRKKFLTYAAVMVADLIFIGAWAAYWIYDQDFLGFIIAVAFALLGVYYTRHYIKSADETYREIMQMSHKISSIRNGVESEPLNFPATSLLSNTADNLNDIQGGIRTAVEEQMKSERMKIELVTNVSHDIKTPLTSLVSYTELLSNCEDMPDEAKDYVSILKEKLKRLTELIGNLFDLSRATSNEMELVKDEIDFKKLVNQVDAQFSDSIEESTLKFIYRMPDEPVMLYTDGAKIHRVVENLYINALKYSLEGSRVYVSLMPTTFGGAEFSITNVSREEIDYTAEEIMARFVRGDKTRSTEGSGLGLAIARSFTELCGGQFAIDLNGDVFKVTITF